MTIAGFTGTRNGMTKLQKVSFKKLSCVTISELHLGDCIGSDADAYHLFNGKKIGHPPTDNIKRAFLKYDEERESKPYLERNRDIVNETDTLIATPDGKEIKRSGTWATIRYARKKNKEIIIIEPNGTFTFYVQQELVQHIQKFTSK